MNKMAKLNNNNAPLGFQAESVKKLKSYLPLIKPEIRKQLCIVKEKKPKWWYGKEWKQMYSFQDKSKFKNECIKWIVD